MKTIETTVIQAILLDRDGVINEDSDDYIKSPDEWRPIPGSLEAIAHLNRAGYKVGVATNQSGLARGYFTEQTLALMHEKFYHLLAKHQGHIDALAYCPHGPDEGCDCRKPKIGLITALCEDLDISPENCLFVGDSYKDIQAAQKAGCQAALVKTGKGQRTLTAHPMLASDGVPLFKDLNDLVKTCFI